MERRDWFGLVGWLVAVFIAAAVGSLFDPGAWYDQLAKPDWTPPDWVFGPVWTLLYGLMAVAAWLVWKEEGFRQARGALTLFGVQLVLNVAWSALFFGFRNPALALADIALLWVAIVATIVAFWRIRPFAGGLLLPYLVWVTYAAALNFEIWRLRP